MPRPTYAGAVSKSTTDDASLVSPRTTDNAVRSDPNISAHRPLRDNAWPDLQSTLSSDRPSDKYAWFTVGPGNRIFPGDCGHVDAQTNHSVSKEPSKALKTKTLCEGTISTGLIKAGVSVIKKSVFHVDNLDVDCTTDEISNFLKDKNITLFSCHRVKS